MAQQFKARVGQQMFDIAAPPGEIVVDAQNVVTHAKQLVAEMRAQKPCATGHQDTFGAYTHLASSFPRFRPIRQPPKRIRLAKIYRAGFRNNPELPNALN